MWKISYFIVPINYKNVIIINIQFINIFFLEKLSERDSEFKKVENSILDRPINTIRLKKISNSKFKFIQTSVK